MSVLSPTPETISLAARAIRDGELVVMPTETVYGLAADALNADAIKKIYEAKGRPSENPLIVHIGDLSQVKMLVREWPEIAQKLAEKYWPGPLTLVLPKKDTIPTETTGNLDTVAIRMPNHPIARKIIQEANTPVAAPSANVFMALSPTKAEDIDPEIDLEASMIVDGGSCEFGLESTVLDLTDSVPRILRPGAISRAEIQALIGQPIGHVPPKSVRAPGMYRRHYAPKAPVMLVDEIPEDCAGLTFGEPRNSHQLKMPNNPKEYGVLLYGKLRQLDIQGVDKICVENPPKNEQWEAVWDRLQKASSSLA